MYGRDNISINENSILVTIPYERLGTEVYAKDKIRSGYNVDRNVSSTQDKDVSTQDTTQDEDKSTQDKDISTQDKRVNSRGTTQDRGKSTQDEIINDSTSKKERILEYCSKPRSFIEIAEYLGLKQRKSVRKYLSPLLEQGRIAMTVPEKPQSKNQKYVTIR